MCIRDRDGKVCGCIKHFAGYGGAEAGREYNTVQVSELSLIHIYITERDTDDTVDLIGSGHFDIFDLFLFLAV